MKISENGLNLIKEFEGLSLKPYLDVVKIPTIGWGNTYYPDGKKVTLKDKPISEIEATELLSYVAQKDFGDKILQLVKVPLNQNQFDALVSICYNIGMGNFSKSTLLKKINQSDFKGASLEFEKWNKSGGIVLAGLVKRRLKEKALFIS
jgi:lysozyme